MGLIEDNCLIFSLRNSADGTLFSKLEKTEEQEQVQRKKNKSCLNHAKFEASIRYPSGNIKWTIDYKGMVNQGIAWYLKLWI